MPENPQILGGRFVDALVFIHRFLLYSEKMILCQSAVPVIAELNTLQTVHLN